METRHTADFTPTFNFMKVFLACCLWLLSPVLPSCQQSTAPPARSFELTVYKLADGDSFEGRTAGQTFRIRLYGIDAPEKGQDFYRVAKDRLGALCAEGPVKIVWRSKDDFGRLVADAYTASGKHINATLVAEGLAWHFTRYSNSAELAQLERNAREQKRGLWVQAQPLPPWEYRKSHRRR